MCGVIGYASLQPRPEDLELLRRVALESRVRGLHAFGWGWAWPGEPPATQKFHALEEWIEHLDRFRASQLPTAIIGHARYSTSGDWRTHANNQPLYRDGIAMVFNGTIDMSRADNDGELALEQLQRGEEQLVSWLEDSNATFAGCWIRNGALWAFRKRTRPLWEAHDAFFRAVVVASTRDILQRASLPAGWVCEDIKAGELQCLTA